MKDKLTYILLLLIFLVGCSDSVEYNPDAYTPSLKARYLSVSQNSFDLPDAEEYSQNFSVTSTETPWGFTGVMAWIDLSMTEGLKSESLQLSVDENLSGDNNRLGVFYLESKDPEWSYTTPISVFQPAAVAYALPAESTLTFSGGLSNRNIAISSNCTWTSTADVEWLTAVKSADNEYITVSVTENLTDASRSGTVLIAKDDMTLSVITVTQRAAEVTMEASTLEFEKEAGAYELKLVSEVSWTACTGQNWIAVTPASGDAGESILRISALSNDGISERRGYVYIKIGDLNKVEIPIYQRGLYIELDKTDLEFSSEPEERTLKVNSNTSWVIESYPDWVKVSPASGEGPQDVTISVEDNPNVSSRTAAILVTQPGLNLQSSLNITQAGKEFDFGGTAWFHFNFSEGATVPLLQITTNGKWEAVSNDPWISVSPTSMTGSAELMITLEPNSSYESRIGTITLTIGDKSYTLYIEQSGKYFTVDFSDSDFGSKESSLSIEISTDDKWTAKVENNAKWITLSQTDGDGSISLVATIADNPSVNDRTAVIVIETINGKSVRIPVSQAARYLTVDHQKISFYETGGTSEDIAINTDAQYSITCHDAWLAVTEKGYGVFNVSAAENRTKEMRVGTVTISMTDLEEGTYSLSLPVFQIFEGANFKVIGYGEDKNFDIIGSNSSASLTVIGYGTDKNWNTDAHTPALTVTVTGYKDDKDFNSSSSSGSVSYDGYDGDSDFNSSSDSSGSVSYGGYDGDNDYNSSSGSSGSVSYGGYSDDKNWNN